MRAVVSVRRAPAALAALGASMRVRLTLWYLAILALVFLVFSGILVGEVRQNEDAAQRAILAKIAQQMASAYSPADGLIHLNTQEPVKYSASKAQGVVGQGFILPAQGVALFVDPQGRVIQAIGPLTTKDTAQVQAFLLASASAIAGAPDLSHAAGGYGSVSLSLAAPNGKALDFLAYTTDVISQG
ncbi:MAG TPA: hypothetical protein VID72_03995, partial [Ktedonobacterales bacterium]